MVFIYILRGNEIHNYGTSTVLVDCGGIRRAGTIGSEIVPLSLLPLEVPNSTSGVAGKRYGRCFRAAAQCNPSVVMAGREH